jgi:hypothetical protein
MSHIPKTPIVHRFVGDPFQLRITVQGLTQAQVTAATFRAGSLTKTLGDGITVDDEDGTAVLVVDVTRLDSQALGRGHHDWQAAAGGTDPPVVAYGGIQLDPRL